MCDSAQNGPKWGNPAERRPPGSRFLYASGPFHACGPLKHPDSTLTGAGRGRVCGGAWQGTAAAGCDTIGPNKHIRRVLSGSFRSQGHRLELRPDHRGTNGAISVAAPQRRRAAPPLRGGYKCVFRRGQDERLTPQRPRAPLHRPPAQSHRPIAQTPARPPVGLYAPGAPAPGPVSGSRAQGQGPRGPEARRTSARARVRPQRPRPRGGAG